MLTVKEIAEGLKVHEQTVYRWITRGELKVQRISGLLRITEEAYQEFIGTGIRKREVNNGRRDLLPKR